MNNTWIRLYRKLRDNPIWKKKPFSKGQAWVDLLLRANYREGRVMVGNKVITVLPGQVFTSEVHLSEDWGWSRQKVRHFEGTLLVNRQICTPEKTSKYTILTLTEWARHQNPNEEKNIKKDIKRTSLEHQKDTYNNNKNLKNDKKSTITMSQINNLISQFPSNLKSLINEYIDIARLQNKTEKISMYRQHRLINELFLLWQQYDTDNDIDEADYRKALKITINNQAPNINYVRKVIQGIVNKRSMRIKGVNK